MDQKILDEYGVSSLTIVSGKMYYLVYWFEEDISKFFAWKRKYSTYITISSLDTYTLDNKIIFRGNVDGSLDRDAVYNFSIEKIKGADVLQI